MILFAIIDTWFLQYLAIVPAAYLEGLVNMVVSSLYQKFEVDSLSFFLLFRRGGWGDTSWPQTALWESQVFLLTLDSRGIHWPKRVPISAFLFVLAPLCLHPGQTLAYHNIFLTLCPILVFLILQMENSGRRPILWRVCLTVGYWSNSLTLEDWNLLEGNVMKSWVLHLWNDAVGTRDALGFLSGLKNSL